MQQPGFYQNLSFSTRAILASDCLKISWELVKSDKLRFIGATLLLFLLLGCLSCLGYFIFGPLIAGFFYVFLARMENKLTSFGDFFKGFEHFLPTMVIGLINSIPEILYSILAFAMNLTVTVISSSQDPQEAIRVFLVPLIIIISIFLILRLIFSFFLFFAIPLSIEYRLGAMEALKLSARAAMANWSGIISLFLLQGAIFLVLSVLLSLIMFGFILAKSVVLLPLLLIYILLNVVFLYPLAYSVVIGSNALAYRQVFPKRETFQSPPPPMSYGSEYGTAF